jgi:hypothetical protein
LLKHGFKVNDIGGLISKLACHDDLAVAVDCGLSVIALNEVAGASLHDAAVGIGEVALSLRFRRPIRIGLGAARRPSGLVLLGLAFGFLGFLGSLLLGFQGGLGFADLGDARFPALEFFGNVGTGVVLAEEAVFLLVDLLSFSWISARSFSSASTMRA